MPGLARRFPPPWSIEDIEAAFVVRDHDGQKLAYIYCEEEPGRRSAAKMLTRDEARRIAANIAKLPGLLQRATTMIWVWTAQTLLIATAFHLARARGRPPSQRAMWEILIANGVSGAVAVLHG